MTSLRVTVTIRPYPEQGMALYMNRALIAATGLILVLLVSSFVHAQQPRRQKPEMPEPESLKGRYYLGLTATNFYHRSIGRNGDTANTPAYGLIFGKYMNDFIKMEFRGGAGHDSDSPASNLEVEIDYYASAYMGVYYQWSLFSSVYAQVGMSQVESSARGTDLGESRTPFSELKEDYLETSLGPSFILGVDTELAWNSKLFLEAGRLHDDSVTNIQVWQYNTGIRFEF